MPKNPSQSGKVIVITGGTAGLGRAAAVRCVGEGATVVLAVRDADRGRLTQIEVEARHGRDAADRVKTIGGCDLADLDKVRMAAQKIRGECEVIDALVLNAGAMATPGWRTAQGFEYQTGVNFLGHFLLANLLMWPVQRRGGRVVTVASKMHEFGRVPDRWADPTAPQGRGAGQYPYGLGWYLQYVTLYRRDRRWFSYANSKALDVEFGLGLADRLEGTAARSVVVNPGVGDTALLQLGDRWRDRAITGVLQRLAATPAYCAETMVHAITADVPNGAYIARTGLGQRRGSIGVVQPGKAVRSRIARARHWAEAERATRAVFELAGV